MSQLSFLDEVARANLDEYTTDPAHIRKQQRDASWVYQRRRMINDWQRWQHEALARGDVVRAAYCETRLAFVEGL